jgi:methylenetetrahydrofolate reductase (NADPH)
VSLPFSFEVFPPRKPELQAALHATIQALAEAGPQFITVTYGANGSSRDASLDCLRYIRENTDVEPLAHLTCVGSTRAEITAVVDSFMEAGIRQFLALRGDPPEGSDATSDYLGELSSATELVQLIHARGGNRVTVSVAAFPNGHPQSSTPQQDIDVLLAKQAAGAEFALTQLFFDAADYLQFAAAARQAGVTMPIIPGIMPVTSLGRLRRIVDITGERMPAELETALESAASPADARAIGTAHAVALCRALVAGGAPSLHLYAFNEHETVLAVLAQLGAHA